MKRIIALLLAMTLVFSFAACANKNGENNNDNNVNNEQNNDVNNDVNNDENNENEDDGVMTYAEYEAAALEAEVVVEVYVQATQSWWNDQISVYAQDQDGAYFIYNMACTEEDAAKLTAGTKIRVTGYKGEWSGEVEILDATFEFVEGAEKWVAESVDMTEELASEDLIKHQNKFVSFTGMTVVASTDKDGNEAAFLYAWDGSGSADSDSDLFFTVSVNGAEYTFVIEYYLCGPDSDAYKAVQGLEIGDVIDIEGFLYWYNGAQPHVTKVTVQE